jgi:hypothetical protein
VLPAESPGAGPRSGTRFGARWLAVMPIRHELPEARAHGRCRCSRGCVPSTAAVAGSRTSSTICAMSASGELGELVESDRVDERVSVAVYEPPHPMLATEHQRDTQ